MINADHVHERLNVAIFRCKKTTIGAWWNGLEILDGVWRLYVNSRPGGAVSTERGRLALAPGRAYVIPPWTRFGTHARRRVEHHFVHFDVVGLPARLATTAIPGPVAVPETVAVRALVAALRSAMDAGPTLDLRAVWLAKATVMAAVAEVVAAGPPAARAAWEQLLAGPTDGVRPAVELIERRLGNPPRNDELAAACDCCRDHFIRRFRQATGQTPARYALDRRLGVAAERLAFGTDSIDAIAAAVGFKDRFHFSRAFKARMGVPPAAYRRGRGLG